jgi:hypothetical protein
MADIFGRVTCEQAGANLQANMSAMSCPTAHGNAVPVDTLDGERVAALCLDCDQQLPPGWAPALPGIDVVEGEGLGA